MPRPRPTWNPASSRRYARPGGPFDGPTLDVLLSAGSTGATVVDHERRLGPPAAADVVARLAGGLHRRGVRRRDVVAWQLPNCLAATMLLRACWRLGAVAAPVLHSLGAADAGAALDQVDPRLTLELDEALWSDPDALVDRLGGPAIHPPGPARPTDLAVALFTSGSTGRPKAVLHTHRALSWKARLMAGVHDLGPDDAVLMPAPLAHISGLLNGVLVPGACAMTSVLVRRFEPEAALRLVETERISFMAGPPTFFVHLVAARESGAVPVDTSSLRLISSGGAAVTPAFVESTARALHCRVKRTYGSTEAPTVTTSTHGDPHERARDTEGRAVGEVELRVVDPQTRRSLRPGRPGELWVRGPELFVGYAEASDTKEVTARGGWFRTGDLATVDDEGWLQIVGRLKDVIIRGGENISASEVQAVLEAHPAIRHAVALGYPDPVMGERVAAVVVASEPFDLEACRSWFTDRRVARFKTPERVVQVDRLPLLGSGKPDRAALERLVEATT